MSDEPGTYDEKLYRLLIDDKYSGGLYCRRNLGEGMEVVDQVIWGWWKPRFLLNHNLKTAYEWMYANQQLAIVDQQHIDSMIYYDESNIRARDLLRKPMSQIQPMNRAL